MNTLHRWCTDTVYFIYNATTFTHRGSLWNPQHPADIAHTAIVPRNTLRALLVPHKYEFWLWTLLLRMDELDQLDQEGDRPSTTDRVLRRMSAIFSLVAKE